MCGNSNFSKITKNVKKGSKFEICHSYFESSSQASKYTHCLIFSYLWHFLRILCWFLCFWFFQILPTILSAGTVAVFFFLEWRNIFVDRGAIFSSRRMSWTLSLGHICFVWDGGYFNFGKRCWRIFLHISGSEIIMFTVTFPCQFLTRASSRLEQWHSTCSSVSGTPHCSQFGDFSVPIRYL